MDFSKRAWYLLAVALPVAGWLLATAHLAGQWNEARESAPALIGGKLDAAGSSVLVFTDLDRGDADIRCTARGSKKFRAEFEPAPVEVSVVQDGTRWYLIGMLVEGRDSLKVSCAPADGGTDVAQYATALVSPLGNRTTIANAIGWGGLFFGLVVAVVIVQARYRELVPHE